MLLLSPSANRIADLKVLHAKYKMTNLGPVRHRGRAQSTESDPPYSPTTGYLELLATHDFITAMGIGSPNRPEADSSPRTKLPFGGKEGG